MKIDFLPTKIKEAISNIRLDELIEIRLRKDFPIIIKTNSDRKYLYETQDKNSIVYAYKADIDYIISEVTESSFYAHNDKIRQGYLICDDGTRIGLSGECVYDKETIISMKNISSLNIRFCQNRENSSKKILEKIIYNGQVLNSLIISPPTKGKTTLLKDLTLKLNSTNNYSILIIDERNEFISIKGENIDVISNCTKFYGFSIGIRSMAPDIVITDEISSNNDWKYLSKAKSSGVKIIGSCHGIDIKDVISKAGYRKGIFDRYFLLNPFDRPGTLQKVYDGDFNEI